MNNKSIKSVSVPQYSIKYAHEIKLKLIESRPWKCTLLAVWLLSFIMVLVLSGCSDERIAINDPEVVNVETPTPSLPPTPEQPKVTMAGFITQSMLDDSQKFTWDEFQRLANGYGFVMKQFSGDNEVEVEIAGIEQCIDEGYAAIFVSPSDIESILPALEKAKDAGLIIGMFASELPKEHQYLRDFFVIPDNYLGGKQAGEFVSFKFSDGAKFVEVGGQDGHDIQIKRRDGFREGIADNIIELDSQNCPTGWKTEEAKAIMEEFIDKYNDEIDIVFCHWDIGASGVIEALQNAGMTDVFVIGFDGKRTGYQQVRDGVQALCVGYSFTNMAARSLENARIIIEGGAVPVENFIQMELLTIENVPSFSSFIW